MNNVKNTIRWADFSINPVKGLCPVGCPYCYARSMYKRFHLHKDGTPNPVWDYTIRYDHSVFIDLPEKPGRVFVGSTIDLFHPQCSLWNEDIFRICRDVYPQHTFIFLTKRPENLIKLSPFPKNCHIGVSVTEQKYLESALCGLSAIQARVRFLSLEPLLGQIKLSEEDTEILDWLVCGQQTPVKPSTMPKIEWIQDIVHSADTAGIPVFLKDNLRDLLPHTEPFYKTITERTEEDIEFLTGMSHVVQTTSWHVLRQEMPKE